MTYCQTQKTERGFTLVELAIVLIIVGLLIGGILKGQELIQNACVTATVSQIKAFEAASNTFRDSFGTLPGDLAGATARLPNCTNNCAIGAANGNGTVTQDPGAALAGEGLAVFPQMQAADLISGVETTTTTNTIGTSTPRSEIGNSGFTYGFANGLGGVTGETGTAANWQIGHYVGLTVNPANAVINAGAGALKATDAAKMDYKIDDGLPNNGTVRAAGAVAAQSGCAAAATDVGTYGNITTESCSVFVRIQ